MFNLVYLLSIIVLITGLFIMLTSDNYLRKIFGLGIFQSSVLLFYIALGKVKNGVVPIDFCVNNKSHCEYIYSSPLPNVLMLTAIVVGFATMSVGLALIFQIYKEYGTISEIEVIRLKTNSPQKNIK